jgi:DDE family transposase
MDWQLQLVTVYFSVCDFWRKGICESVQRFSNNTEFKLTDQEIATLYLFGVASGKSTVRSIYDYADRHLREWFPHLGEYKSFCYRLNRISTAFASLCEAFARQQESADPAGLRDWVVDSLPIIMAGPRRSGRAKVARELADKGFCASKELYFYGVKLHCVGLRRPGTIPFPSFVGMAPASVNDEPVFEQISPELTAGRAFGDKAYGDSGHKRRLSEKQNIALFTPIKKSKGLFNLPGPETYSAWVSAIRQPIESFFNWLQVKTSIQFASKVRSAAGLIVHTFGKLAAAMLLRTAL